MSSFRVSISPYTRILLACLILACAGPVLGQTSTGIGTTTPDSHAALDISSTAKGVLFPSLNAAEQTTLAGMLGAAETGMLVTDAATGALTIWNGSAWQKFSPATAPSGKSPISITANTIKLNPGTAVGDLVSWDGVNWVNKQPAVQHFSISVDNHQPFVAMNYVIALFGIFPSQNDASEPYIGEIYLMGCNFAPTGFALCEGQVLSIAQNSTLFNLIGTTYGGDGTSTFNLPDLRGRIPIHEGSNGSSNYIIGQFGGIETMTFTR